MKLREALYYTLEGKFYGEYASGVGTDTSAYILLSEKAKVKEIKVDETFVDRVIMWGICEKHLPPSLSDRYIKILNAIPELKGLPPIDSATNKKNKERETEKMWSDWQRDIRRK